MEIYLRLCSACSKYLSITYGKTLQRRVHFLQEIWTSVNNIIAYGFSYVQVVVNFFCLLLPTHRTFCLPLPAVRATKCRPIYGNNSAVMHDKVLDTALSLIISSCLKPAQCTYHESIPNSS